MKSGPNTGGSSVLRPGAGDKLDKLDLSKYSAGMRSLIERNMEELRTLIERKEV